MDIRYNLQNLSEAISNKKQMPRKDSEAFVRAFFDIIGQYLVQEKIVKVKGLGTFKLVDVQDRESVDVNTGERIVIKGHIKVTFTPENSLRDQVNKPFADFETVIINDGTDLKAMEDMGGAKEAETDDAPASVEAEVGADPGQETLLEETEEEAAPEPEENEEIMPQAQEPKSDSVSDSEPVVEEVPVTEGTPVVEETPAQEEGGVPETVVQPQESAVERGIDDYVQKEEKRFTFRSVVWMFVTVLLMLLSYYAGYYRMLCPCPKAHHPVITTHAPAQKKKTNANVEAVKSAGSDSIAAVQKPGQPDTIPTAMKPSEPTVSVRQIERYPQVPGGKYLIVGLERTHVMKAGDNLYKISRKYYGHYDGVQYIVTFNDFENPDVIPPGYKIKIPQLKKIP